MASKADKDAEDGSLLMAILMFVGSLGFFYWTKEALMNDEGLGTLTLACCNIINIMILLIFLATWRSTKKSNKIIDYIEQYVQGNNSITASYLMEHFNLNQESSRKVLSDWAKNTRVRGKLDLVTGVFEKTVEMPPESQVVDVEFIDTEEEEPDVLSLEEPEQAKFCPHCGAELADADGFCGSCGKKV